MLSVPTITPIPSIGAESFRIKVPVVTVVPPVWRLSPESVRAPTPVFKRLPVPVIGPVMEEAVPAVISRLLKLATVEPKVTEPEIAFK